MLSMFDMVVLSPTKALCVWSCFVYNGTQTTKAAVLTITNDDTITVGTIYNVAPSNGYQISCAKLSENKVLAYYNAGCSVLTISGTAISFGAFTSGLTTYGNCVGINATQVICVSYTGITALVTVSASNAVTITSGPTITGDAGNMSITAANNTTAVVAWSTSGTLTSGTASLTALTVNNGVLTIGSTISFSSLYKVISAFNLIQDQYVGVLGSDGIARTYSVSNNGVLTQISAYTTNSPGSFGNIIGLSDTLISVMSVSNGVQLYMHIKYYVFLQVDDTGAIDSSIKPLPIVAATNSHIEISSIYIAAVVGSTIVTGHGAIFYLLNPNDSIPNVLSTITSLFSSTSANSPVLLANCPIVLEAGYQLFAANINTTPVQVTIFGVEVTEV
jgi:hypothetical protein